MLKKIWSHLLRIIHLRRLGGTGRGIPYRIALSSNRIVSQELNMSCGAACVRQLLRDEGIELEESLIREQTDFTSESGISSESLASALNTLNPLKNYRGGGVAPEAINALMKTGSWIARVKPSSGAHYILVDKIEKEVVFVREPWGLQSPGCGQGLEAQLILSDFVELWTRGINQVVFEVKPTKQ